MMVHFTHKQLSEAGGPTLMQGPSTIIKSSPVALMLCSVDGPLSLLPIHQHLVRVAVKSFLQCYQNSTLIRRLEIQGELAVA